VQDLFENDLVDQVNLMIFPVVLGTGKKIFGDYSDKKAMKLVESKIVGDGVVVLIYERV
jgi:dihydrofolate reductase